MVNLVNALELKKTKGKPLPLLLRFCAWALLPWTNCVICLQQNGRHAATPFAIQTLRAH